MCFAHFWIFGLGGLASVGAVGSTGAELPFAVDGPFAAKDSLEIGVESNPDTRRCLDGLAWPPAEFAVRCEESSEVRFDAIVRFPSPVDSGDAVNDRVAMEWYLARDEKGKAIFAPAVIVVHESGSKMTVGRLMAFSLSRLGLNTFMIQLPGYGLRKDDSQSKSEASLIKMTRQSIADVRRARDAVSVLPLVDKTHIAIQGTSLGGFVTATSASLDAKFDSVFILLAGADLYDVVQNGQRDAAKLRERLAEAGVTDERLKELMDPVEPKRVAHRLKPDVTWLFSAKYDNVVPPKNCKLLAEIAKLSRDHHIELEADHYSGVIFLPEVLMRIRDEIKTLKASKP